jgi:(p)ppGpp synthase/HD superfamily hydrolase
MYLLFEKPSTKFQRLCSMNTGYCHCEIAFCDTGIPMTYAALKGQQVTVTQLTEGKMDTQHWDWVHVTTTNLQRSAVEKWLKKQKDKPYNHAAYVSIPSGFKVKWNPDSWFCSELTTAALQKMQLRDCKIVNELEPQTTHPGGLYAAVQQEWQAGNRIFTKCAPPDYS